MTYDVSSGTLNPTIPHQWTLVTCEFRRYAVDE